MKTTIKNTVFFTFTLNLITLQMVCYNYHIVMLPFLFTTRKRHLSSNEVFQVLFCPILPTNMS